MGVNKERLQRLEKERLGEERVMNCGLKCKIIEYPSSKHITVEFENGKIIKDKIYSNFIKGNIAYGKRVSPMKHKSLTGNRFGKLIVGELIEKRKQSSDKFEYYYSCHCDCGRDIVRGCQSLRDKNYDKTCGKCPKTIEETINYQYPEMVKYFKNIQDTFKYKCGSHEHIDMVCNMCGHERKIQIKYMIARGFSCPICSDGISYPEKFIIEFLNQSGIEFVREKIFDWAKNKRYDFYISSLNCIIETHGSQHYKETRRVGARSLSKEKENDELKEKLAKSNGIKEYIQLDCRESKMDYIVESIIKSRIIYLININNIDFYKCSEYATSNITKEVCAKWNEMENKSTGIISKELRFSRRAISEYLKIGNEFGWCEYDTKDSHILYRDNTKIGEYNKHKVKCLELDLEFNSVKECCEYMMKYTNLKFIHTGVSANCSGKRKHYRNYHFKYINN